MQDQLTEIEAELQVNPEDQELWAVYGDLLMEQGDGRGELIAMELGRGGGGKRHLRVEDVLQENRKKFWKDSLDICRRAHVELRFKYKAEIDFYRTPEPNDGQQVVLDARMGVIRRADIHFRRGAADKLLRELLASGDFRFLEDLSVGEDKIPRDEKYALKDVLGKAVRKNLRKLHLQRKFMGQLAFLAGAFPNLRELSLDGSEMGLAGMDFPELKTLKLLNHHLNSERWGELMNAKLPRLEEFWFYYQDTGNSRSTFHFEDLLNNKKTPGLRRLCLNRAHQHFRFGPGFYKHLLAGPVDCKLEYLVFNTRLEQEELNILLQNAPKLRNLKAIYIGANYNPYRRTNMEQKLVQGMEPDIHFGPFKGFTKKHI